jgi:3-oxoadipate enol-lactonase/4-carboxymuconolactone decarboxylase
MHGLATTNLTAAHRGDGLRPLLVVGPSLGTSVTALWSAVADRLADRFDIVGFDLPGHGRSVGARPVCDMASMAAAVLSCVDACRRERGGRDQSFLYAGVSVSGCIGLQLLLDAPARVRAAVILNSAARIGETAAWLERAATVRRNGPASLRESSAERWFAPGFVDRAPATAAALLKSLDEADAEGYAGLCEALAAFDVRARLSSIDVPVLAIAGAEDVATPPPVVAAVAAQVAHGRFETLARVGHLAPAERADAVATSMSGFFATCAGAHP